MTDMNAKLKNRIDELIREDVLSGTSLIMSIFGDCIFQRGGVISLSSLIQLMDVFGFKFALGTSTGISSVNAAAAKKNGKTYNMAGQEVSSSAKGLIIKNGKKYVK